MIATQEEIDAHNSPEAFQRMPPREQEALRMWVRLALRRTNVWRVLPTSYGLKHNAEDALGWYIGNGEMKGAMLAEGYGPMRAKDLNWSFAPAYRCPHSLGRIPRGPDGGCPLEDRLPQHVGHWPSLCQATPQELAKFDRLAGAAYAESVAEQMALRAERAWKSTIGRHAPRPAWSQWQIIWLAAQKLSCQEVMRPFRRQ